MELTGKRDFTPPELQVAFTPPRDLYQTLDRFQPFLAVLGEQGGFRFRFQWRESRHRLLMDMWNRRIDLAFVDGVTYLFGTRFMQLSQLGTVRSKGRCQRLVVLIVRDDSPIFTLTDLRGKRYGISDPLEIGNLWIDALLEQQEVTQSQFFSQIVHTVSDASGILDVIIGRIDATVVDEQTLLRVNRQREYQGKIRIIATSPPLASCVLVSRPGIDPMTSARLGRALMEMEKTLQGAAVLAATGIEGFDHQPDEFFTTEQKLLKYFLRRMRALDEIAIPGY